MTSEHYLGNSHAIGLRQVAALEGQWVALLGWQSAVFQNRPRDGWIGWHPAIRTQGLCYIANQARFLILPSWHIPNLASKVLSLATKRLAADWEDIYGWRVALAETFVDPTRFRGSGYLAAGWKCLGESSGYKRTAKGYFEHTGHKKLILVKPLIANAQAILANPLLHPFTHFQKLDMATYTLTSQETGTLYDYLRKIPDRRQRRGKRHLHVSILTIVVGGILSGRKSLLGIAEWAKQCTQAELAKMHCRKDRKTGKYIPPSEPTIRRALNELDVDAADEHIGAWVRSHAVVDDDAIAVDGKTLRGSGAAGGHQIQLVAALLHKEKLVIAQKEVHPSTNEQKTLRPLLEPMDIKGRVITVDAAHTQEENDSFIVEEKGADYLFTVKGNQPRLRREIEDLHLEAFPPSGPNSRKRPRQA